MISSLWGFECQIVSCKLEDPYISSLVHVSTYMLDHVWEHLVIRMPIFVVGYCSLCIKCKFFRGLLFWLLYMCFNENVPEVCTASLKTSWTTVMHLLPPWGHQYRLDSIYRRFNMLLAHLKKNWSFESSFISPDGDLNSYDTVKRCSDGAVEPDGEIID